MYRKMLRRRMAKICFTVVASLVLAVVTIFTAFAIRSSASNNFVTETEESHDLGTVSLSDVNAPRFTDEFCTLILGEREFPVQWGEGTVNVMWYESGYPGFNMPMVVEGSDFSSSEIVKIATEYGFFEYRCTESGFAFEENHNLIDLITEKTIINFGVSGERLFLYDKDTKLYCVYEKCNGTKIIL